MAHHRFDANLSFLNQEVEIEHISLTLSSTSLQEKAGGAEIAYLGNVPAGRRFPVHPQIVGDRDARRSSAEGPVVTCIVLTVFTQDRESCFRGRTAAS